jgi:hypothetical protein
MTFQHINLGVALADNIVNSGGDGAFTVKGVCGGVGCIINVGDINIIKADIAASIIALYN